MIFFYTWPTHFDTWLSRPKPRRARACPLKFLLWRRWVDESSRRGKLGVLVIWFQAFQILQSNVSEMVAPIEFDDQCISLAMSPRLTKVDTLTHGLHAGLSQCQLSTYNPCMYMSFAIFYLSNRINLIPCFIYPKTEFNHSPT